MSKLVRGTTAALAVTLLAGGGLAGVANASSVVLVRQADLIPELSATRSAGHVAFLNDGLHVWTDDATSNAKAAEYFALDGSIPASASLTWFGTQPQPGQQLVFDADGIDDNGNDWNILVGEPVYGANWWLTNSSSQTAKDADPSGVEDGGNGSAYFGTLADWKAALPEARVYAGGFSLGSGVKGDGVIDAITYGGTEYRFTKVAENPAPTVANVTGYSTVRKGEDRVRIDLYSRVKPDNSVLGEKLAWVVRVDGKVAFKTLQGFDDHDVFRRQFEDGSGKHTITVFKNGVLKRTITVRA